MGALLSNGSVLRVMDCACEGLCVKNAVDVCVFACMCTCLGGVYSSLEQSRALNKQQRIYTENTNGWRGGGG